MATETGFQPPVTGCQPPVTGFQPPVAALAAAPEPCLSAHGSIRSGQTLCDAPRVRKPSAGTASVTVCPFPAGGQSPSRPGRRRRGGAEGGSVVTQLRFTDSRWVVRDSWVTALLPSRCTGSFSRQTALPLCGSGLWAVWALAAGDTSFCSNRVCPPSTAATAGARPNRFSNRQ
jgi:hypothetical protein